MSQEFPWFPLWVDDFRMSRAVRRMSMEAVGLYTLVLCEMWDGGPLPDDVDAVADLLGRPRESIEGPWKEVRAVLEIGKNGLLSPRLEAERRNQENKAKRLQKAGKKGAQVRWRKGLDGKANATAEATGMRGQCYPESESETLTPGSDSSGGKSDGPRGGGRISQNSIRMVRPSGPIDPEWERAVDEATEAERRLRGVP